MLVALERVAEELDLRRGRPGDHQDADLLADDPHRGRRELSSRVSSGPASSIRARYSYWPTTLGTIRNVVRLRMPSSPRAIRWLATCSQSPPLTRLLEDEVGLDVVQSAGLDDDRQGHRVVGEDHRAGLDLDDPHIPRALLAPGRDREDRDVQPGQRLGHPDRVFAGVRAAVGDHHDPRHRPPPVHRQDAPERVAQGGDRPLRLDLTERPRAGRAGRDGLRGRLQVVERHVASPPQVVEVRRDRPFDQVQPGRLPEPIHRRLPPLALKLQGGRGRGRAGLIGVGVREPHALRVIDDDRQVRPDRLPVRRDQDRLDQHDGDRREHERPQATSHARLGADSSRFSRRGSHQSRTRTATIAAASSEGHPPARQRRQLEPRALARRHGARRPRLDPQE